jgi:hypothetical protein
MAANAPVLRQFMPLEAGQISVISATARVGVIPSAFISTVTVLLVSPAAKLTVPVGSAPPTKSLADAGLVPEPITAQLAVLVCATYPERVTVKVNGVLPVLPSDLTADAAAIAREASSF